MTEHFITKSFSNIGKRNEVRMRLVEEFSKEIPGNGKHEEASRYTYYVETLLDERRIFLRRPANLHNGFDFLVCVENTNFSKKGKRKRNFPKHDEIVNDLLLKQMNSPEQFNKLLSMIEDIYFCRKNYQASDFQCFTFNQGFSADLIALTLKWLFIEQDIRYWNYSGRAMLWQGLSQMINKKMEE
ncbi:DNA adenine methylase [Streptococcus parasanguinis]|uniref:DNA adenine methylase n=1 Tax=Streptococcus parasanguinis TaxID=1318 RepID=UPI0019130CCA|nr:DNA adenine methylase [Streptococcus parasanguinis]MBK5127852.1 DNA adenine methylase [Streptococcus parasanguinis]